MNDETPTAVLTESQQARRGRILDSALSLAAEGGYEAVQMREVAADADVALGTLYRYFPSKEHLLASVMAQEILHLRERLAERPPRGDTPADRVVDVLRRGTRALLRNPNATAAMMKAFASAEPSMAPVLVQVRTTMNEIIADAVHAGEHTGRDLLVAQVLQSVWMASLTSWINGLDGATQVGDDLEAAARLLLAET